MEFIKEGRANNIAITSSEIIYKAIELIHGYKEKSYNFLQLWFMRFRLLYSYSIRILTKIAQTLPKNFLENIKSYLSKDNYSFNNGINSNIIANLDETQIDK